MERHQKQIDAARKVMAGRSVGQLLVDSAREALDDLKRRKSGLPGRLTRYRVALPAQPADYSSFDVKRVRNALDCSQAVFASFLGVSPATVQSWEQGKNKPQRIARRLMDDILSRPNYWQKQLKLLISKSEQPTRQVRGKVNAGAR